MKKWILGACNVFLLIFWTLILKEYMANHTYYYDMLNNTSNLFMIIATLVCAAIPVGYILYWKNATLKWFSRSLWIWLLIYGILYASIRESILGTGAIMRVVNSALVFWCWLATVLALTAIGGQVHQKLYGNQERSRRQILLAFGLGFCTFVAVNYFLILMHVYYARVNRLQVILLWYLTRKAAPLLKGMAATINQTIRSLYWSNKSGMGVYNWLVIALILISIAYYFIGFKMAYIPYPTARDANHAYMLMPNAISNAHGHSWNTHQPTGYLPVYISYIAFFFSLIKGLGSSFRISPDTFGVEMNYLTAIFTFIITLGIIDKVLDMVSHKNTQHRKLTQMLWWFAKVLWLTSGMGAFLVFVDNKTDFAIMYLSSLGLYAGLGYIDYIIKKYNDKPSDDISKKEGLNDLYISWFFFAIAIASKITALFDAMNFVLLIVWFILGWVVLVWISLIILAIFANLWINGVGNFISKWFANMVGLWWGALVTLLGLWKWQQKHSYSYRPRLVEIGKHIASWWLILLLTVVILKLPIALFRLYHDQTNLQSIPKEMLFGKWKKPVLLASNNTFQVLLAQNTSSWETTSSVNTEVPVDNSQLTPEQCTLQNVGLSDTKDLYTSLLTPPGDGYSEDVGRYVWFGQKSFTNPWWWFLVPNKSCVTINKWARVLCNDQALISSLNLANAKALLAKLKKWSEAYELVDSIVAWYWSSDIISTYTADKQKLLADYRQDKTIYKDGGKVDVPYKLVVPLNVTFNRSLQNLSSYYTDIGIIWLIMQFFLVVGLLYGILSRNRLLWTTNLVAVIGWVFWIAIGGGIIRYGIGLITWTIIGFVLFVHSLYEAGDDKKHADNHTLFYVFCWLFVLFGLIQLSLNLVRIASQGWSGPFLQYSYSNGQAVEVDETLQQKVTVKFPYKWTDIMELQFPFYRKTINAINAQTGKQVNLIAGTYLQYRVNDQSKLVGDGLLVDLRKNFSDGNLCKSYLRLKDKDLKYLIIDPNIATIVMGGGNNSLLERFFAKLDPSGRIVTDGTFSTIGKLINKGYIKLFNSNNLGAKYGFGLSSDYLKSKFGITNDDDLALLRARLATVRFRGNQEQMIQALSQMFTERVANGEALSDIADIYGKIIDEDALKWLLAKAQTQGFPSIAGDIKELSQDERFVLLNYLNLVTTYNQQPQQFPSVANGVITQSLGGWSQLIVFEVK